MNKVISTPDAPKAIGPYSQAIESNGTLYISGQIPLDHKTGEMCTADIKTQTRLVLTNMGAILKAAGCGYNNVVKTTCLLNDINDFAAMNEVYAEFFSENPPARSAFAVRDLPKGAKLEIEAIATIDSVTDKFQKMANKFFGEDDKKDQKENPKQEESKAEETSETADNQNTGTEDKKNSDEKDLMTELNDIIDDFKKSAKSFFSNLRDNKEQK